MPAPQELPVEQLGAKERTEAIGRSVLEAIMTGKEELLSEKDRLWIRMRLRLKGVRMDKLFPPKAGGGGFLSAREPNELRDALGGSEELKSAILFVMEKLKKEGGQTDYRAFLDSYFAEHTKDGRIDLDLNNGSLDYCRVVAIVSAMHRLLKIVGCDDPEKAQEMQKNVTTAIRLRERVLRHKEGVSMEDSEGFAVARLKKNERLRKLPPKAIEAILEVFCGLV